MFQCNRYRYWLFAWVTRPEPKGAKDEVKGPEGSVLFGKFLGNMFWELFSGKYKAGVFSVTNSSAPPGLLAVPV